ncbi:MAG: PKD domain-containing protein, partial [Actinomycetia bacterium]|nr:PKD domain-containing protein [Actinomycetes bacterium]
MAKKRHLLTLSSLMAIAILAVVSISPATGQTNQLPIAEVAASPTSGAVGDWFLFDGTASVDPDGTISLFEWDFGDGTTPLSGNGDEAGMIFHTFAADGTYTVTLTVTDDGGAVNSPTDPKATIDITIGTGTT